MISLYKYTDKEIDEMISSLIILVDTREKNNIHITESFDKNKISYKRKLWIRGITVLQSPRTKDYLYPEIFILISRFASNEKGAWKN